MSDQNLKSMQSMLGNLSSIENNNALPKDSVSFLKELNQVPKQLLNESGVSEEQLTKKITGQFRDYLQSTEKENPVEQVDEYKLNEYEAIREVYHSLSGVINELKRISKLASRAMHRVLDTHTIPALLDIANNTDDPCSLASLAIGSTTEEFDKFSGKQIAEEKSFATVIGPDKSTVVESKKEGGKYIMYVNNKQFGKTFESIDAIKKYAQVLDNSLNNTEK